MTEWTGSTGQTVRISLTVEGLGRVNYNWRYASDDEWRLGPINGWLRSGKVELQTINRGES